MIEAYRAERVQASELEETLGISKTELCRLNRNYFRYRLLPLLYPKHHDRRCGRKAMKRDVDYVRMLEKKLADMEKETHPVLQTHKAAAIGLILNTQQGL